MSDGNLEAESVDVVPVDCTVSEPVVTSMGNMMASTGDSIPANSTRLSRLSLNSYGSSIGSAMASDASISDTPPTSKVEFSIESDVTESDAESQSPSVDSTPCWDRSYMFSDDLAMDCAKKSCSVESVEERLKKRYFPCGCVFRVFCIYACR